MKKIIREISLLRQLSNLSNNNHIVKLLDVIVDGEINKGNTVHFFLVFELMESDLFRVLDNASEINFTENDLIKILYQLLCSLKFLDKLKVLHRDIKSQNIMLDGDFNVKLCDFGLARFFGEAASQNNPESLSEEKIVDKLVQSLPKRRAAKRRLSNHVVSRFYRSPEIALVETYSTKADVWSAGCVLSEMVMSLPPYAA